MLVRFERDATGDEASQFVAELAAKLVEVVDRQAILDDLRDTVEPDIGDLLEILVGHFKAFVRREDEEVLDWVIDYLMKGGD